MSCASFVERVPDDEVPAVLADVRRHLSAAGQQSWPPAFFGSGRASRSDVAARSEEILAVRRIPQPASGHR